MRKDWRPETYGNWSLWDEGGMRDIEGSRENVLVEVVNGSAKGWVENRATHLL